MQLLVAEAMDLSDPTQAAVAAGMFGLILWLMFGTMRSTNARIAREKRILSEGTEAQARVKKMTQVGGTTTASKAVRVDFELEVNGLDASIREYMPMLKLGRVSEGDHIPVRFDPDDPTHPVVDWERV